MNISRVGRSFVVLSALAAAFLFSGCEFDVPLAERPDRKVDSRLVGEWVSRDGWMMVRRFDPDHYAVFYNGGMFRGWHATVAGRDFVIVEALGKPQPKYYFFTYAVDGDRGLLELKVVGDRVLSSKITDSAALRAALERVANDPRLLGEPVLFSAMKR